MEIQQKWIMLLCCVATATVVKGLSSGAPPATCGTMMPGHGFPSQDLENSPYRISIAGANYSMGMRIRVSVSGDNFKGMQCQVRNADSDAVGRFDLDSSNYKTLDCGDGSENAITHTGSDEKDGAEFTWVAPRGNEGIVKARCTIVSQFTTYWVGLESNSLMYNGTAPPMTTASSETEGDDDNLTAIIVGIVAAVTAVVAALGAAFWFFFR